MKKTTRNKSKFARAVSLIVAVLFTLNTVAFNGFAFAQGEVQAGSYPTKLSIPAQLGALLDFQNTSLSADKPFIIHIQDAHANPEAQKKIYEILKFIDSNLEKNQTMRVAVEGAAGKLHPEYLNVFSKFPKVNQAIVDDLANKGELSGAELFAWSRFEVKAEPDAFQIFGAENPELYSANLKYFRTILYRKDEIQTLLKPFHANLELAQSRILNPGLRSFIRERQRRKYGNYTPGQPSNRDATSPQLVTYIQYLAQQVEETLSIDLEDKFEQVRFPHLTRLLVVQKLDQVIDSNKAATEKDKIVKLMRKKLRQPEQLEIVNHIEENRAGITVREDAEKLWQMALEHRIDLAPYQDFWRALGRTVLVSEITGSDLFKEMETLETWLIEALAIKPKERQLVELMNQFRLFEGLLSLEIDHQEFAQIQAQKDAIFDTVYKNRVGELLSKHSTPQSFKQAGLSSKEKNQLQEHSEMAWKFYEGAVARDQALLGNALKAVQSGEAAVLIAGGFHTNGLVSLMKEQGVGYAVIQPKISEAKDRDLYYKVMRDEHADLSAYLDKPYLTKQEALLFKGILEIGIPALFETYNIPYGGIAGIVAAAINQHDILKGRIISNGIESKEGSKLEFEVQERSAATRGAEIETSGVTDAAFLNDAVVYRQLRAPVEITPDVLNAAPGTSFSVDVLPAGVQLRAIQGTLRADRLTAARDEREPKEELAEAGEIRSESREETDVLDALPEGAQVSGRIQFISHKKAPGTASFSNAEEIFYGARSKEMKDEIIAAKGGFEKSKIITIPEEVRERIFEVFPLSEPVRKELSKKDSKQKREPATFREQIYALMDAGVFQIQIDDMGSRSIKALEARAKKFNMRNLRIDKSGDQPDYKVSEMLFPRFGAYRNPMGAMSFLTIEEVEVPADGGKTKKEWKALIHITKALWETIYDSEHQQIKKDEIAEYFLSQLVMHEIVEAFLAPQEQVTNHRMASILEIDLASKSAREKGVSDINLWYLNHGTPGYLAMLEENYRIDQDTTMGAFYQELWNVAGERKVGFSRTQDTPKWEQRLVGDHTVKRAYGAPPLNEDQKAWLEKRYSSDRKVGSSENAQVEHEVPTEVRDWIKKHQFGPHFKKLLELTDPAATPVELAGSTKRNTNSIVFKVDNDAKIKGQYTYQLPEYMGERRPGILFFLTQQKDARGRANGPVEIHMTAAAWDKVWTDVSSEDKDKPSFLAQVLVYAYIQNYLPSDIEGLGRESWANLSALQFASKNGQDAWINDLNLFFLDTAAKERNINYLYDIMWNYELMRDVQGNFRRALFDRLNGIWNGESNKDFFIDAVESIEDLVVFYTYLHEEVYIKHPLDARLLKIAEMLEYAAERNPLIRDQLKDNNSDYLFKVRLENVQVDSTGNYETEKATYVSNPEFLKLSDQAIKARKIKTLYILQSVFNFLKRKFEIEVAEKFEISDQNILELRALKTQLEALRAERNKINMVKGEKRIDLENAKSASGENILTVAKLQQEYDQLVRDERQLAKTIDNVVKRMNEEWGGYYPPALEVDNALELRVTEEKKVELDRLAKDVDATRKKRNQQIEKRKKLGVPTNQIEAWEKLDQKVVKAREALRIVQLDQHNANTVIKDSEGEDIDGIPANKPMGWSNDRFLRHITEKVSHAKQVLDREKQVLKDYEENTPLMKDFSNLTRKIRNLNGRITGLNRDQAVIQDTPFAEWMFRDIRRIKENGDSRIVTFGLYGGAGTGKTTATGIVRDALAGRFGDKGPVRSRVFDAGQEEKNPEFRAAYSEEHSLLRDPWKIIPVNNPGYDPNKPSKNTEFEFGPAGKTVNFMGADPHLKPSGVRYVKTGGGGRYTIIGGPTVYNASEMVRILEGLKQGVEVVAPDDPSAPYSPAGTTFDDVAMEGNRSIFGRELEVLILDVTVFGLSPSILPYVDEVVPVVFEDDTERLVRRFHRDSLSKLDGGSRGDSVAYVAGDFAQKQIQEGFWYKLPMIRNVLSGDTSIWVHDRNELVKLRRNSKNRFESRDETVDETVRSESRSDVVSISQRQNLDIYTLSDPDAGTSIEVMPGRGNTVISMKAQLDGKEQEILYYPEDLTKSGGIPILWPFANRIRDGQFTFDGKTIAVKGREGTKDAAGGHTYHGMVRYAQWQVVDSGRDVRGSYITSQLDTTNFPAIENTFGKAVIEVTYRLKGNELAIETRITNKDQKSIPMSLAFHPWFLLPEDRAEAQKSEVQIPASKRWVANGEQIPLRQSPVDVAGDAKFDFRQPKALGADTFDDVFTDLAADAEGTSTSTLSVLTNDFEVTINQSREFTHTVLYTPPDAPSVNIEQQTSASDAFNLANEGFAEAKPVILQPGKPFNAKITITASPRMKAPELKLDPSFDQEKARDVLIRLAESLGVPSDMINDLRNKPVEQVFSDVESYLVWAEMVKINFAIFPGVREALDWILKEAKIPQSIMTGTPRHHIELRVEEKIRQSMIESGGVVWGAYQGAENYPKNKQEGMQRLPQALAENLNVSPQQFASGKVLSIGDGRGEAEAAFATGNPFVLVDTRKDKSPPHPLADRAALVVESVSNWREWLPAMIQERGIEAVVWDWDGTLTDFQEVQEFIIPKLTLAFYQGLQDQAFDLPEGAAIFDIEFARQVSEIARDHDGEPVADTFVRYLAPLILQQNVGIRSEKRSIEEDKAEESIRSAIARLNENGYEDSAKILEKLYPMVLPHLKNGESQVSIDHAPGVVDYITTIMVGEKTSPLEMKRGVVAALMHDAGTYLATAPKYRFADIQEEEPGPAREKMRQRAILGRKDHMKTGARLAEEVLDVYNETHGLTFTATDIREIKRVILNHDNPSIQMYEAEPDGSWLFKAKDRLLMFLREADRIRMINLGELEFEIARMLAKNPETQPRVFVSNLAKRFFEERDLYLQAFRGKGYEAYGFKGKTLFRTKTGYDLFVQLVTAAYDQYEVPFNLRLIQPARSETRGLADKNVEAMRANMNPAVGKYTGYDIVVVSSTTPDEQMAVSHQIGAALKGRAELLAVNVDIFGGGPMIDSLRSYEVANRVAKEQLGKSIDELQAEGRTVTILPNLGKGERAAPIALSQNNSRGATRLGGVIQVGNEIVPISLLNLKAGQVSIFAESSKNEDSSKSYIDHNYVSSVHVVNSDVSRMDTTAPFVKQGRIFTSRNDFDDANIKRSSVYEIDEQGRAIVQKPKETFKTVKEAQAWYDEVSALGHKVVMSAGSHRIRRDMYDALRDYFGDRLMNDPALFIEPPDFIPDLLNLADALERQDFKTVRDYYENHPERGLRKFLESNQAVLQDAQIADIVDFIVGDAPASEASTIIDPILKEMSDKTKTAIRKQIMIYKDGLGIYKQIGDTLTGSFNPRTLFGFFEMGEESSMFTWSARNPRELVMNNYLNLISDIVGGRINIGRDGSFTISEMTESVQKEAELARKLHFIDHPITNTMLGSVWINAEGVRSDTGKAVSFEDVKKGITIGGVEIKGSIILDSNIPEGTIVSSVVEGRKGKLYSELSAVQQSAGKQLNVARGFVYNVLNDRALEVQDQYVTDIFRPGIEDDRFPEGQSRLRAKWTDADGKAMNDKIVPDSGNILTYRNVREMQNDPAANNAIRDKIEMNILRGLNLPSALETPAQMNSAYAAYAARHYPDGPVALAAKAVEYEQLATEQPTSVIPVLVEGELDGEWRQMWMPVPKSENPNVVRDYLANRIFNTLIIESPSALRLKGPVELRDVLESVRELLIGDMTSYAGEIEIVKTLHEMDMEQDYPIEVTIDAELALPTDFKRATKKPATDAKVQEYFKNIQKIEGIAIGVDVGGTDVKLAVMEAGRDEPLLKEHVWSKKMGDMEDLMEIPQTIAALIRFANTVVNLKRVPGQHSELQKRADELLENEHSSLVELAEFVDQVEAVGVTIESPGSVGIAYPDIVTEGRVVGGRTNKTMTARIIRHPNYDAGETDKNQFNFESPAWRKHFDETIRLVGQHVRDSLRNYYPKLEEDFPVAVTNDGNIGSLWAGALRSEGGIYSIAGGTSLGGGYLNPQGTFPKRMYELGYLVAFLGDPDHKHFRLDIYGAGFKYFTQYGAFDEAERQALELEAGKPFKVAHAKGAEADTLKRIQAMAGDPTADRVFEIMGEGLASIVAAIQIGTFIDYSDTFILFGRPVRGAAGDVLVKRARETLQTQFAVLGEIDLQRASEFARARGLSENQANRADALAQAMGTAFLANATKLQSKLPSESKRSELRANESDTDTALLDILSPSGTLVTPGRNTAAAKDAAAQYLRSNRIIDVALTESQTAVAERFDGYFGTAGNVAKQLSITEKEAVKLILQGILGEDVYEGLNPAALEAVTNFAGAAIAKSSDPIRLKTDAAVEELSGENLTKLLNAVAGWSFLRTQDEIEIYVQYDPSQESEINVEHVMAQYNAILTKLGARDALRQKLQERLKITLVPTLEPAGFHQALKLAAKKQDRKTPTALVSTDSKLARVNYDGHTTRINRSGYGLVERLLLPATYLRERLVNQLDILDLQRELEQLGVGADAASRIAIMIKALESISSAA